MDLSKHLTQFQFKGHVTHNLPLILVERDKQNNHYLFMMHDERRNSKHTMIPLRISIWNVYLLLL